MIFYSSFYRGIIVISGDATTVSDSKSVHATFNVEIQAQQHLSSLTKLIHPGRKPSSRPRFRRRQVLHRADCGKRRRGRSWLLQQWRERGRVGVGGGGEARRDAVVGRVPAPPARDHEPGGGGGGGGGAHDQVAVLRCVCGAPPFRTLTRKRRAKLTELLIPMKLIQISILFCQHS